MRHLLLLPLCLPVLCAHSQVVFDDAYLDPDFLAFKTQLHTAVLAQDSSLLAVLLADSVVLGDGYGRVPKAEAIETLTKRAGYNIWKELQNAVRMGFASHQYEGTQSFIGPGYLLHHSIWDEVIIPAGGVRVRALPSARAQVVGVLSFTVVEQGCSDGDLLQKAADGSTWVEVCLPDGQAGYVLYELTSMAYGLQFRVEKVNGAWKLTWVYAMPGC